MHLLEAAACVLHLACVCECVSVLRLSRRLALDPFSPLVERSGRPSSASRNNNRVFGELFPALRLHEDEPEACVQQTEVLFSLLLLGGALRLRRAWRVRLTLTAKEDSVCRAPRHPPKSERASYSASSGWCTNTRVARLKCHTCAACAPAGGSCMHVLLRACVSV